MTSNIHTKAVNKVSRVNRELQNRVPDAEQKTFHPHVSTRNMHKAIEGPIDPNGHTK